MAHLLRQRTVSLLGLLAGCAVVPGATVHFFGETEVAIPSGIHFFAIGISAGLAAAAAVALTVAGARRGDARSVLIGTAFSSMAALLAVHGFTTPGFLVGMNGLVAFSGAATLPVGGAVLALSAIAELRRPERCAAGPGAPGRSARGDHQPWRGGHPDAVARAGRARGGQSPRLRRDGGGPCLLRSDSLSGRQHLPAHAAPRGPGRRVRTRAPRHCADPRPAPPGLPARLVARPRLGADRLGPGGRARGARPSPRRPVAPARGRPACERAGERRRRLHGTDRARAARAARRQGRLHRRAHARRGAAGRPGGRGARPGSDAAARAGDRRARARRREAVGARTRSCRSRARSPKRSTT